MTGTIIRSRRLRDRRRTVRRQRLRRYTRRATALAIAAAVVAGGAAVAGSSLFALDTVQVVGTRTVSKAEVRAAAALRPGANVLTLDLDGARRRVGAIRLVRSAQVRRAGALGVRITVVERTPAVVVRIGAKRRYFDVDGVEVPGPARGRLPMVRLHAERVAFADERVLIVHPHPSSALITDVLRVWAAAGDLRASLGRFDRSDDGLVVMVGGARAVLGDGRNVRRKLDAVRTITTWARSQHRTLRAIDVSVPDHPAIRVS